MLLEILLLSVCWLVVRTFYYCLCVGWWLGFLLVALLLCFFALSLLWSVVRIFALLCVRLLAVLKCC